MTETLSLTEVADQADVTTRTVRYYIQHGLLPAPGTAGPGAHYDQSYVDRIHLIKRLQKAHLPLAEIRERLSSLEESDVRGLLEEPDTAVKVGEMAAEYVRHLLHRDEEVLLYSASEPVKPDPRLQRSQWERIELDPDVELHVRRPLTREKNRALQTLLEEARTLFGSEES